jgi:hypothetical protein
MRRTASAAASARRGMPQAIEVHGLQGGRASSSLGLGYGQGALFYLEWNNMKLMSDLLNRKLMFSVADNRRLVPSLPGSSP